MSHQGFRRPGTRTIEGPELVAGYTVRAGAIP